MSTKPTAVPSVVAVLEVLWLDDCALNDREEDFDLVQPGRVDGQMDEFSPGPRVVHAFDGAGTVVGGAVINDPEHSLR